MHHAGTYFNFTSQPHLDYTLAIWPPHLKKVENIQKFMCHMATRAWYCGYQDLFDLINLPTFECRHMETQLSLLYYILLIYFVYSTTYFTHLQAVLL